MNNSQNLQNKSSIEIPFVVWLRTISVFLIILCHLTRANDNPYIVMSSQIFNVGVQIFIIISGYLFGRLGVKRPYIKWLYKRFKRIFIPYWTFLVILLILQSLFGQSVSLKSVLFSMFGLQRFTHVLPGAEHTWFITAILLCYIITPLIDLIVSWVLSQKSKIYLAIFICINIVVMLVVAFTEESAILTTCPFFALAFVLGKTLDEKKLTVKHAIVFITIALISFAVRFIVRFFIDDTFLYVNIIARYSHYIAAFGFFIACAYLLNCKPWKTVKLISNVSFEIYLYHYMFIRAPLSVMSLTGSWVINSIIAIACSIITAWLMNWIIHNAERIIEKNIIKRCSEN